MKVEDPVHQGPSPSGAAGGQRRRRFSLLRAYSLASLVGIAVAAVVLVALYRASALDALKGSETEANVAFSRALAGNVWPRYGTFIERASFASRGELATDPEAAGLRADVLDRLRGLPIVVVKIFNLDGTTVFATDPTRIGEHAGDEPAFQRAKAGEVVSEIVFKGGFSALEQGIADRDLLSLYVPVQRTEGGPLEGVFELHADVTPMVDAIGRTGYTILIGTTVLMFVLYLFLLGIVRRADRIIKEHDREERQEQHERIRYLAYHDGLTGLPNRNQFSELLELAVKRAERGKTLLGVMAIDLDRFKAVNDSLGHELGDRVLIETARRIQAAMPGGDPVARMGGDEFTVVLENLASSEEARQVAERLFGLFATPIRVEGREISVTLSIGIAFFPTDAEDPEELVKDTLAAMHKAKGKGPGHSISCAEELSSRALDRFELEMELHKAVTNREFVLHYQPKVCLGEGKVLGMEALVRWRHPTQGLLPPIRFIPLLEESGLVSEVGAWMLGEACRQCKAWHDAGYKHLRVSVNLSLKQFRSASLVTTVRDALAGSGLPPRSLDLELTESALAQDRDQATRLLHELKALGVTLSLDDFGTGYSSLSYLMHFPIDCLKVDRSFVRDVTTNAEHATLTNAIVTMAKSLHLSVVAEGVEDEAQLDYLRALGCDEVQGYLFSPAVPPEEFLDRVAAIDARSV